MKKNKLLKNILFCVSSLLCLASCSVEWNGDLLKGLDDDAYITVEYRKDDNSTPVPSFTERYLKGSKLTQEKLASATDPKVMALNPGYTLQGWNFKEMVTPSSMDAATFKTNQIKTISKEVEDSSQVLIDSIELTDDSFSLYGYWTANINTPYKIRLYKEPLQDGDVATYDYEFWMEENHTGKTDTTVELKDLPLAVPLGFEKESSSSSEVTIAGDGSGCANVYYKRKEITFTFNVNNSEYKKETGKYETPFDINTVSAPTDGTGTNLFYGWYEGSTDITGTDSTYAKNIAIKPEDFPAKMLQNKTYYAVWGLIAYDIGFKDMFGKPFTGTLDLSPENVTADGKYHWETIADSITFAAPTPAISGVTFAGWYMNEGCIIALSETNGEWELKKNSLSSVNVTLYAKWNYTTIYLDPANGSDENNGMTAASALKTVAKARTYAAKMTAPSGSTVNIMLLSSITDPEDIAALKGFEGTLLRQLNGGKYTYPFIYLKTDMEDTQILQQITLDGGAVWKNGDGNSASATDYLSDSSINKGNVSTTALIINEGTLNIGEEVNLINNCNTSGTGGAIQNMGKLVIKGTSGSKVTIKNNYSVDKGGGIYQTGSGTFQIENAEFLNNASKNGGGIAINLTSAARSNTLTGVKINNNKTLNAGGAIYSAVAGSQTSQKITISGNDNEINNNTSGNSGGGVYLVYTELVAENCTINKNSTGSGASHYGGGIAMGGQSDVTLKNVTVSENKAVCGGGISCTGSNNLVLDSNTIIIDNYFITNSNNIGKGIYASSGIIKFTGGKVNENNDVYVAHDGGNSTRIKIMADYSTETQAIALVTPKTYSTAKALVEVSGLDDPAKSANQAKFNTLFKISKDSEGKSYDLITSGSTAGYLNCTTGSGSGTIVTPLERDISFTVTKQNDTYKLYLKYNGLDITSNSEYVAKILYMGSETGVQITKAASNTSSDNQIIIPENYPSGIYRITIDGTYLGTPFYKYMDIQK